MKWLASRLRPFGIHPRTMRIGNTRAKGYNLADFTYVAGTGRPRSRQSLGVTSLAMNCIDRRTLP